MTGKLFAAVAVVLGVLGWTPTVHARDDDALRDLPLVTVPATGPATDWLAAMLTGDGVEVDRRGGG